MKDFILKNQYYLIIITCLLLLMPILLVGSYDRPVADDYDFSIVTHAAIQNGGNFFDLIKAAIQTDIKVFNGWSGLYSSSFIQSLQPGIFGESFYGLTCVIVLVIAFLCLYFSMRILNKHYIKESNTHVFTCTLVMLTILALLLPSATQGLYWYNGAINYMPWAFCNFLGMSILIELYYTEYGTRKYYRLLGFSILLSFLTSGGNHVTGFANILFMLIFTIFLVAKKKRYYSVLPLLLAIVGYMIVFSAPGTANRQVMLNYTPSITATIIMTFNQIIRLSIYWLNFKWILSLIIITPVSLLISKNIKDKINTTTPIISIICWFMVIGAMLAIPYYAMGHFGRARLTNVIWVTFIILSWVNYTLVISALEKNNIINFDLNNKSYKKWFGLIIIVSLLLMFCIPQGEVYSNSYICLKELNEGTAEKFSVEMDDRINVIKSSNQDVIKVKPITQGSLLYFTDITKDPTEWKSVSMERYYNKKSISLY